MAITYRDEIGTLVVYVNREYGISFCDGFVYFSDNDDHDYKIPVSEVISIM